MEVPQPSQPVIPPVQQVQPAATSVVQNTQPVFYSLSPEAETPKPTPFFRRKQMVVMAVSALVLMAVATGVIVFAMNIMQSNKTAKQTVEQKSAQVNQMVANGSSPTAASREAGFVDGCKALADEAYLNCVTLIAIDQANPTICNELSGEQKTSCVDRSTLSQAKSVKSYAACSAIKDAELLASCQMVLSAEAAAAGNCAGYGAPSGACDIRKALEAVVAAGDITACNSLSGEDVGGCEDIISTVDADGDGLTIQEEFKYGTSDAKADTDGDGYNDGDEIASSHDPLKK